MDFWTVSKIPEVLNRVMHWVAQSDFVLHDKNHGRNWVGLTITFAVRVGFPVAQIGIYQIFRMKITKTVSDLKNIQLNMNEHIFIYIRL